ncbi:hypothetical protein INR49_018840 [Caranx melampygus]|nr:hypothetical protein INR49_018840 [Caranx melampygus]
MLLPGNGCREFRPDTSRRCTVWSGSLLPVLHGSMAAALIDPTRAPVAFGRRAVPRLFEQLQPPDTGTRLRALASLCDLIHDPERLCETVNGGAQSLLTLVPKLMLKLREEAAAAAAAAAADGGGDEEEEVLLLSTLACCSRLDALPALACDGSGKRQVCEEAVLPVVVALLQDEDIEVQANAAGVVMNTVIITTGKQQCLDLDVIPVLLHLVSEETQEEEEEEEDRRRRRKALILYSLRALTSLAEAPDGRQLLLEQLPLLVRRSQAAEEDQDIRRGAQTAVRVITWTP